MKKTLHALVALTAVTLFVTVARAQEVYAPGDGVSLPTVLKEVRPYYTSEAVAARIQGVVELEVVVLSDGKVGDVKVFRSLDNGLDQEAVKSMKQWEFKPGQKDGKPVAVRVQVNIKFTLK
jgi:protein TonB